MRIPLRTLVALVLLPACGEVVQAPPTTPPDSLLAAISRPVEGGRVALVRMTTGEGEPAFAPAEVRVRQGDVVRFVLTSARPESVAFDTAGLSTAAADFVRRSGIRRGPLLTRVGEVYDVSFRDAPAGRYLFASVPHASRGMRGAVVVEAPPR